MDYTQLILFILQAGKEIYDRHASHGEILTDEMVAERLNAELAAGQHKIIAWFLEKGLPPPQ